MDIERLIETAFDGAEHESEALRQGLSASEAKELDSLVLLKSDLKRLGVIPECQLTTEHLRQAVLNSRPVVAPKRSNSIWIWATPFVAAAALALVFVTKNGQSVVRSVTEPSLAAKTAPGTASSLAKAADTEKPVPVSKDRPEQAPSVVATKLPTNSAMEPSRRKVARKTSNQEFDAVVTAANKIASSAVDGLVTADYTPAASAAWSTADSVDHAALKSESKLTDSRGSAVVVVSDHANPMTGVAEAQEVSKPSDVVFGG